MNHPNDKEINKFDWKLVKDMWAIMKPFWVSSGPQQKWFMAFFLTIVGGFTVPVLKTIYAFFTQHQIGPDGRPVLVNDLPVSVTLESLMPDALLWTAMSLVALVFLLGFKGQLASRKRSYLLYGSAAATSFLWLLLQGFSIPWLAASGFAFAFIASAQTGLIAKHKFVYSGIFLFCSIFGYSYMMDNAVLTQTGTWLTSVDSSRLNSWLPYVLGIIGVSAPVIYFWKFIRGAKDAAKQHVLNLVGIVTAVTVPVVGTVAHYLSSDAAIDVGATIAGYLPWTMYTAIIMAFIYGFKHLPKHNGELTESQVGSATRVMKFVFSLVAGYLAVSFFSPAVESLFTSLFPNGVTNPWILGAAAILLPATYLQLNGANIKAKQGNSLLYFLGMIAGFSIPVASIAYSVAATGSVGSPGIAADWTTFSAAYVAVWVFLSSAVFPQGMFEKLANAVASLAKYSKFIYPVGFAVVAYFGVNYVYDSNLLASAGSALVPDDGVKVTFSALFAIAALAAPTAFLILTKKWMDEGWRLLAILTALMFSVTGFNVLLTYLMRDMWDALRIQDAESFWVAIYTVGVIFVVGIFIVVPYRYVRDLLGVRWRLWMSEMMIGKYMKNRNYYKISQQLSVDNPEQRISQDIRAFTGGALAFLLMILDSVLVVAAFAVVLYTISPMLTYAVLVYALVGSFLMAFIGKRLIGLNFRQEELEANFYYQAVHVRNNSEAIAFFVGEDMESKGLIARLGDAIRNYNFVIRWERNMAFFQKGYDYLVVIVPLAIVAPLYFAGEASMGEIQQANSAFSQILGAMSLFVSQFTAVTSFAANIKRLRMFEEELDKPDPADSPERPRIERHRGESIVVDDLTLITPNYVHTLIKNLDLTINPGESILVMGRSGSGKSSLLRGIAGLWRSGDGAVTTPDIEDMMFMPQKPYLPIGSLREQFLYPHNTTATDEDIFEVLKEVNLQGLVERFALEGGLDAVLKWDEKLSGGEQQRVAMARLLLAEPRYAIVDEASSALDDANEEHVYQKLQASGTTYISVGHRKSLLKYHDRVLYLVGDGTWEILDPTDPKVQE